MRRGDKTGGKTVKTQRRKTSKRRNSVKVARRRGSSAINLQGQLDRRTRDLDEALEQQAATADILNIISNSPTDTQPVFDAIVQSGLKLFPDALISLALRYEDMINAAAIAERDPERAEAWRRTISRTPFTREYMHGAALLDCRVVDIPDVRSAPAEFSAGARNFLTSGYRAITITPMMRRNEAIGLLSVVRRTPGPLSDKQLSLLRTFAAQAVIAIENTRLLSELRESLQQQTATADVLKVISRSTFDLQVVLDTLVESAARLCEAERGIVFRREGETYKSTAHYNYSREFREFHERHPIVPGRGTAVGRTALEGKTVHIPDVLADPEYTFLEAQKLGQYRANLAVPLLREGNPIGALSLSRSEPLPFSAKQIELVETFADQAVIAIENARLLSELRESLQQQTATADVLKVISRSTFDLQTVLNTLTESAARLCTADRGVIFQRDEDLFRLGANYAFSHEAEQYALEHPQRPGRGSVVGRVALEGRVVHIPDVLADPEYHATGYQKTFGFRTILGVPLLREGTTIGVFALTRDEVNPFTEKQIELVTIFADQAVIAIENVRLFDDVQKRTEELSESLQQQTATADVLKVISRSTFDLQPVLDTLTESAARLCDADIANIWRPHGSVYRLAASHRSIESKAKDYLENISLEPSRGSCVGRTLLEARTVHIHDIQNDPEYALETSKLKGWRTMLGVPLLREGVPVGVIALVRSTQRPFTAQQIELVTTFADQAVIAIENVRLFEDVQARTRELANSLEELRTTQDRLVQTQKLASLGQLTAGIAHEIKNPLNFVNNFSGISAELITELQEALADVSLNEKTRSEITELMDTLRGNLEKVVQHGKRADAIVKNMLLHSREGSGEHRVVEINALIEESLNLAYHGARAEKQGFNITMQRSLDPAAGQADVFPQDLTRVLLNLISNGFYAATKRRAEADGDDYEPTLLASTRTLGDRVEIRVRDNGTGIPPEVKEKMFNPFFTTKPAGEGTGLGLSICHDIIVKQHGGSIEVDTQPGEFTEIKVVLPRRCVAP